MNIHRGGLVDHIDLRTRDLDTSKRFYRAALQDNGGPGERRYHPGYYGAFVFHPDGNNIEAVYHGPMKASAESVVITPAGEGA